jgi:hypothetical protein
MPMAEPSNGSPRAAEHAPPRRPPGKEWRGPDLPALQLWTVALLVLGAELCVACGDGSRASSDAPAPAVLPAAALYGPAQPVPGCEGALAQPCDVRDQACANELGQIAACLRGEAGVAMTPALTFISEQQAEEEIQASLEQSPPPEPNRFEIALAEFGLTVPGALEPEPTAQRLASNWSAFYRRESGDVAVIEHPPNSASGNGVDLDERQLEAVVLHEMIHVLQDRDVGLDQFERSYERDSDGSLRGKSVLEGEAYWYEQRFYDALSGLDDATVDFGAEFAAARESSEAWLFQQPDLYSSSQVRIPYTHGASYMYDAWQSGGAEALRALLATPPVTMRDVLAPLWAESGSPAAAGSLTEPPAVELDGLRLASSTQLGAWGLYLLVRPRLAAVDGARRLALAWQSDRFDVFAYADSQTAGRWWIQLRDDASAGELAALLAQTPEIGSRQTGSRLVLVRATSDVPPALLAPP